MHCHGPIYDNIPGAFFLFGDVRLVFGFDLRPVSARLIEILQADLPPRIEVVDRFLIESVKHGA